MEFWRNNQIDQRVELSPHAVATAFCASMAAAVALHNEVGENPWSLKLMHWPLERTLRDWLSNPEIFNAVWDDEDGFQLILTEAIRQLKEAGIWP